MPTRPRKRQRIDTDPHVVSSVPITTVVSQASIVPARAWSAPRARLPGSQTQGAEARARTIARDQLFREEDEDEDGPCYICAYGEQTNGDATVSAHAQLLAGLQNTRAAINPHAAVLQARRLFYQQIRPAYEEAGMEVPVFKCAPVFVHLTTSFHSKAPQLRHVVVLDHIQYIEEGLLADFDAVDEAAMDEEELRLLKLRTDLRCKMALAFKDMAKLEREYYKDQPMQMAYADQIAPPPRPGNMGQAASGATKTAESDPNTTAKIMSFLRIPSATLSSEST